jgi:hypothetical protein
MGSSRSGKWNMNESSDGAGATSGVNEEIDMYGILGWDTAGPLRSVRTGRTSCVQHYRLLLDAICMNYSLGFMEVGIEAPI